MAPIQPTSSAPASPNAPAAAIIVNSLADGAPANNGQCTLREALLNANADNQSGSTDCVAGSGTDTITFSVNGTINLTGVLPDISQSLTITGPGANLLTVRRNTGGDYRILNILIGQTVNFTGLTIANGSLPASEGGGIRNSGNLTVADCAITGNLANGAGGILNSSSLTMTGSTLSGNTANFDGGGLYNLGNATATLINCTISGNTGGASFNSGVVTAASAGETATTTLNNCTVTANTGNNAIGSFNLGGATVTTQLRNTLVAANSGNNFNIGANTALTSLGNNLDSDGTSGFPNGVGGNLVGTAGTPLNAQLGALANNGGTTQTHALNAGSPAINAGTNTGAPATDQRGISRPQGAAVDIGAFEATANPLLVTNTNDAGAGSLRQAIATANGNGAGLDDIIFDNTVFNTAKTITLTSGELTISDNLTINGPGANLLTVSGANLSRIFNISAGAASVSIAGMTMRDGRPVGGAGGGAILINNGTASGPVNISDCLITNNDVTAASNPLGGGIDNEGGTVTITRSTISNNVASFRGGGLQNQGVGSTMTIVNSTISGNTAGTTGIGGAIRSLVPLTLTSCTVFGNSAQTGGNISRSNGTLSFGNTIIAGGTLLGAGGTSPDVDGTLTSLDYNLIQNTTGATISGTTTRDITGVSPQLGPLTNNGGPTPTHALLAGSPALDKGNSSGSITDQRGLTRPFDITTIPSATGGDNADIGAFETQALIVTNANDSGAGSLRQVLTDANANADLNDILFDATFFNTARTINLASALPALTTSLNINGPGANLLTVRRDTGGDYRVFNILSGKVVTISGLTISNGKTTSGQGGGILNNGTLSLTNCILSGNQASASVAQGGGIYSATGTLNVSNCTLSGNTSSSNNNISGNNLGGGGIFVGNGVVNITGSTFSGNTSTNVGGSGSHGGGGLYLEAGTLNISNSTLSGNTVSNGAGGGLRTRGPGSANLVNTTITNNFAGRGGGFFNNSAATAKNTIIAQNTNNVITDTPDIRGPFTSLGNNLIGIDNFGAFVNGVNNDQVGSAAAPLDAKLAPLGNYGGPTATHALLLGSPALDKGHSSGSTTDQRGLPRPVDLPGFPAAANGDSADIGAFEAQTLPLPAIVINDVAVAEGNAGTSTATFTVTLSAASAQTVTVQYATANGTATAGSDYVTTNGTLTFNPGVTSQPVNVTINGDTVLEQGETFFVNLSNPANAVVTDPQGLGLILNDEPYIVTNANDAGAGSLRQALLDANASPGAETILFEPVFFGATRTINLAGALPDITESLTINGPGPNLLTVRRDAGGDYRIFTILSGQTVVLAGMTITGGNDSSGAGGIQSSGDLTVTNCQISGNQSSVAGGGIFNNGGTLTVTHSTIANNTCNGSFTSGGIDSSSTGSVTLLNTTISGNSVTGADGSNGGGLWTNSPTTITNCTITNNSAAGASSAGGVRRHDGTMTTRNSIIAANQNNSTMPDVIAANDTGITSSGFNLIGNRGTVTAFNQTGDLTGTGTAPLNPVIGALANNGGPTSTHALLPGSPAINAGTNTGAPATDQRGIARVGNTDIGAYESRGFTLAISGGNNQSAVPNANFANPLAVIVTASGAGEPVEGGNVTFTPPGAGASATIAGNPANIAGGIATSGTATANGIAGAYNVAANTNGATAAVNFSLINDTAPTFTPAAALTRQQGSPPGAAVTVGTVMDAETAAGNLIVTQIAGGSATGITVTNIVNTNGTITAQVATSCTATAGTVRFQVSDGSLTGTGDLQVNVTANTPPTLSYANANVAGGGATTINPATGPADNGTINTIVVQSQGTFAGTVTVDNTTGVVSVSNAVPAGVHTINIRATDNCGAQTNASFTLTVGCITSLTVNNLGDGADATPGNKVCETVAGNGICTMRAAIQEANALLACTPLTINFNVTGTIALGTALPTLVHPNLTLQGPGASLLTISGANTVRVLNIGSGNLNVTLDSLTLAHGQVNGQVGGGIQNASAGILTLLNCTITNNSITGTGSGAGISNNAGTLVITNSTISNNSVSSGVGGGIFNPSGTVTITNSTLANNGGINGGGGLWSNASANPVTITGSTIAGNTAGNGSGGGVRNSGSGSLTLTNCTLANNSANFNGGGAANVGTGTLTLLNSTLSNNISVSSSGGGLWTAPTGVVNLKNTLVAGNSAPSGPDISGALTSQGNNLVGKGDGGTGLAGGVNNDQVGTIAAPLNALLAALGNYGGPTQTLALLPGSLAINAGTNTGAPATDQRGIARPQPLPGATADIGAFESRGFTLAVTGGNNQSAPINGAFANPLIVTASSAFSEPVNGGRVTFTPPGVGAGATLTGNPAPIASGQASVTATANGSAGVYQVTAATNDGAGNVAFNLTNTSCPTITITPATLPSGQLSQPYSQQLTQSGGAGAITWSVSAGSLPNNLTLDAATGLLSGTPIVSGSFPFTVKVNDATGCMGALDYTLVIGACPKITVAPATLPPGASFTTYSQQLTASGGALPYSFAVSAGALPAGLTLTAGGLLSGAPTVSGPFNFTVRATDINGCTGQTAYTLTIAANPGLQFYPLPSPVRLLDTRSGVTGCVTNVGELAANSTRTQAARTACSTIPANATAIIGSITVVPSGPGFLTLFPSDATQPTVANSNFNAGEVTNNFFTVGLGADGAFKIFTSASTQVIIDLTGYYAPPSPSGLYYHPLPAPVRLVQTFPGQTGCFANGSQQLQGTNNPNANPALDLTVDGRGAGLPSPCNSIPGDAVVLVGNATTVFPQAPFGFGYLTIYPSDAARPTVASSNYGSGDIINGPFAVKLGADGKFKVYTFSTTHLVIDISGYYSASPTDANGAGLLFNPLPKPMRLLETRNIPGFPLTGCYKPQLPIQGGVGGIRTQQVWGMCSDQPITIPNTARAIVGNVTAINPVAAGFGTFFPGNVGTAPTVATTNYPFPVVFGYNRHYYVGLSPSDGSFKILTQFTSDYIVDVSGYFAP
ncbi:MAG TPA: choice-of-anchor Q domain-containing protein [Blastocatellia bacterium]